TTALKLSVAGNFGAINSTLTGTETLSSTAGGAILTVGARSSGDTTPTKIVVDDSYSSVAGANPKLLLRSSGNGIGESAGSQDYNVATANAHNFYVNAVPILSVSAAAVSANVPVNLQTYK